MGIMDADNLFSEDQAVTAAAASTNVIDLGVARDIGVGEDLFLVLTVTETFADGSSDSTLAVKLETDDNEAFASATDLRDLVTLAALSAAGTEHIFRLEPAAYERYIRLYYTPANGNLSAGKLTAYLTSETPAKYAAYAAGYSIT